MVSCQLCCCLTCFTFSTLAGLQSKSKISGSGTPLLWTQWWCTAWPRLYLIRLNARSHKCLWVVLYSLCKINNRNICSSLTALLTSWAALKLNTLHLCFFLFYTRPQCGISRERLRDSCCTAGYGFYRDNRFIATDRSYSLNQNGKKCKIRCFYVLYWVVEDEEKNVNIWLKHLGSADSALYRVLWTLFTNTCFSEYLDYCW